jgi:hypothetical protein
MASDNALRILREEGERGYDYNRYKKILYEGGYHWMKLLSLKTLFLLPILDFFKSEFIITDKGILMIRDSKSECFWFNGNSYYRMSQSIFGLIFNYGTFTLSRGGGGFGSKPTEYVYRKVKNAILFKATLDNVNMKRV